AAAGRRVPQRLALEHGEHAGIGAVVLLHRQRLGRHERAARLALGGRDLGGRHVDATNNEKDSRAHPRMAKIHSTVILAVCVWVAPWSSVQASSRVPLSVA